MEPKLFDYPDSDTLQIKMSRYVLAFGDQWSLVICVRISKYVVSVGKYGARLPFELEWSYSLVP